jgi:type VI protein secretion system component Hcp
LQCAGITGNCQKTAHLQWLEVDSWSFSLTQPAMPVVGGGAPKGAMATGSFHFDQKHSGPMIFQNVSTANHIAGPAEFDAERGGMAQASGVGTSPTKPYLILQFWDFAIVGRDLQGGSGQKDESITFAFSKVSLGYAQVLNGTMQGTVTKTYDQKSGQVS